MKIKNRPVFLIICLIPKEQNSTDRREKWESLLCHYSLPNGFAFHTTHKQNKTTMVSGCHPEQTGIRSEMICHRHNCIRQSSISVGLPFFRLLFTPHSSTDGKVILTAAHRQTPLVGQRGSQGHGEGKREGACEKYSERKSASL